MPKRPSQSNVLLDEQAKRDAHKIAEHYNLNGVSAAIRFALRNLAFQVEGLCERKTAQDKGSDD